MQKLLLTGALCLVMNGLNAQPWMDKFQNQPQVKLEDVIREYQANPVPASNDEEEAEEAAQQGLGPVKEGHNYQFDRWRWYWEQHLDANGYMVSPAKNFQEWNSYKQRQAVSSRLGKSTASAANWEFQGPLTSTANGNGVGRIQRVVFHPTDSNTFWVCTAGGGSWLTTTNGTSWTCMTDQLPVLGVSDMAYNPLNPKVIYMATGDRDATDYSSMGIFKTTDGGLTWNPTGFQYQQINAKRIGSVLVNPLDTNSILISTTDGIYNSRNGGTTWTLRASGVFRDLVYRPNDTVVVYATDGAANMYRSGDGGATWSKQTSLTGSRISLAVTPANPNMVKALLANSNNGLDGIYTSSDTGKTFVKTFTPSSCAQNYLANSANPGTSSCDGQGYYDLAIAISPLDSNKMVIGGINTWYSTNGGVSWTLANQWSASSITNITVVHADKHFLTWQPLRPTVLFECNDGGIYKIANAPNSFGWMDLTNGLGITEFYRIAVANYATTALGGAQDNGSKRVNSSMTGSTQVTGGDGMNCEMDPMDNTTFFTASQYGTIYRNGGYPPVSSNIPGQPQGDWITPYKLHPRNGSRMLAGYDKMYLSTDHGDNWTTISPKLSSALIKRVAFAPSDFTTMYAIWGNLVRQTTDNGTTWTNLYTTVPGTLSDIIVDPKNAQHFWVTYSGYGTNKVAEYDTTNGWTARNDSLPNVPVNCITYDTSNGTLYIGTDVAVFYKNTLMNHWALWNTNLPAVHVDDLDINYGTGDLWAGTYGRGMWKTPVFTYPPSPAGVSLVPYSTDVISAYPNPAKGAFDIRSSNAGLIGQNVSVNIYDQSGRIVWSGQKAFSASGTLHIDAAGLAPANYILDLTSTKGMQARTKIVLY